MHYLPDQIPLGWALCDGGEYTWEGVTTKTPDLRNSFIKAAESLSSPLEKSQKNEDLNENGKLQLKKEHLPPHTHPHQEHTHSLDSLSGIAQENESLSLESSSTFGYNDGTTSVVDDVTGDGINLSTSQVIDDITYRTVKSSGGFHTHNIEIYGGTIHNTTSYEMEQTWENNEINIEPEHYTLIFIMKL